MAHRDCNSIVYNILRKLTCADNLTAIEAGFFFHHLLKGDVSADAARSVLILLREKGESSLEIAQAAMVLREKGIHLKLNHPYLVDNCGTGGDGKASFNVSTVSALVAAAGGACVVKHGNRSVTSKVGSADLLEALGVRIDAPSDRMLAALKKVGIGYFHAPVYHPVMKNMAPVRKSIQGRTVFNLLGPLLNPFQVKHQVIGVCRADLVSRMAEAVRLLGTERTFVICGEGSMDEATTYGVTRGLEIRLGKIRPFIFRGREFGFKKGSEQSLRGGSVRRNKAIALGILRGEIQDSKKDAVILNAGLTLLASGKVSKLDDGIVRAREVIENGSAYQLLKCFVEMTNA